MRVAVAGATGFIGRALVDRLRTEGHQVRALVRAPERHAGRFPAEIELAHFDGMEEPIRGILDGCEAVVNLAGASIAKRWTEAQKSRIRRSRIESTARLVRLSRDAKTVKTFVSTSAVGFYGPRDDTPLGEDAPPGNDFLGELCKAWEAEALEAKAAGIRVVVLRLGQVLALDGGILGKMVPVFRLGLGGHFGSGRQYMSWISREDAIGLVLHALATPSLEGPVNATAPAPVTNTEFTRALGHALGRPAVLPVPGIALKLAMGEMAGVLVTGQRVVPNRAKASGYSFVHPELEGALAAALRAPLRASWGQR